MKTKLWEDKSEEDYTFFHVKQYVTNLRYQKTLKEHFTGGVQTAGHVFASCSAFPPGFFPSSTLCSKGFNDPFIPHSFLHFLI